MGSWFRRVGAWIRGAWLFVGLVLLCVFVVNELLATALPALPRRLRVDPDVAEESTKHAEAYSGKDWSREYRREYRNSRVMTWQPYVYWRRAPFEGRYVNIDERGLRSTWTAEGLSDDAASVFVFGGSTVWGTGARDDFPLPSHLARLFGEAGVEVRVTNFGESGYVMRQGILSLIGELQRGNVPDLVIFYDGVNDVMAALQSGVAGLPQNEGNRRLEFKASKEFERLLRVMLANLEGVARLSQQLLARERDEESLRELAREIAADYARNVAFVERLAEDYGFGAFFYWQPTIFSKRSVTDFERSQRDSQQRQQRSLQLLANEAIRSSRELGGSHGFRDLSSTLDGLTEPVYLDFCHLSEDGNGLIARTIADDVIPVLH